MAGHTDLSVILEQLSPSLLPAEYVFCSVPGALYGDLGHTSPMACVVEAEGLTLVVSKQHADAEGLYYEASFRCIRLQVHSSLEAVGLSAAVASALAGRQISANMMAGAYHDLVLVPSGRAEEAMALLEALAEAPNR